MQTDHSGEPAFEAEVHAIGRRLAAAADGAQRGPLHAAERRATDLLARDPRLRAALFRLVDVAPACAGAGELADHLAALLLEAAGDRRGPATAAALADRRRLRPLAGLLCRAAVRRGAGRFIAGEDPAAAVSGLAARWCDGIAASVDLLGEATVTAAEGRRYVERCDAALRELARAAASWPVRPQLERDPHGVVPRVNLSVKITAITPLVRAEAPWRAQEDAAGGLRLLLRRARELGAHLHVDVEAVDSREAVVGLLLDVLAEDEFRDGPSAGIVLQAYLRESDAHLDELLDWAGRVQRTPPLTVRLVKGAYWDHELIEAAECGWEPPVFTVKAESDRSFERLTRRLVDAHEHVRLAVASHNVRSVAHAIACARRAGLPPEAVEYQVLSGLGDDLAAALAAERLRTRAYCPVGDLVEGMAYLVRRLLENTANDSFLAARGRGADLERLLAAP